MPSKLVRVEIGNEGLPIRIFRDKSWLDLPVEQVLKMDRAMAVRAIRLQVFQRASKGKGIDYAGDCEKCGRFIWWETFEMNEIRPKGAGGGKTGGEVSLDNCEALCSSCHQTGPDAAHKDRRWQTAKLDPKGS
jgi:5-methylcytosine-specific restriction endonuclease McrA